VSSPRRRGPNCPHLLSPDRPHRGPRIHRHLCPTHSVIPAQAGIQAASRTSSDSALDSRLRGNDAALNDTSVHVTSSTPPITYPPFGSTAFDPPHDLADNAPRHRQPAAYRRSAGGGDGWPWSQGSGFLAGDRRTTSTARLVPTSSIARCVGRAQDAQPHSNEAARLPSTSHPPDFARRQTVTLTREPRGAAARPLVPRRPISSQSLRQLFQSGPFSRQACPCAFAAMGSSIACRRSASAGLANRSLRPNCEPLRLA